jgi:hypothetical protein
MRQRPALCFRPDLERFEQKCLLSSNALPGHSEHAALIRPAASVSSAPGYTLFRITNPEPNAVVLKPPFQQLLVQTKPPVPGQVYNLLSVAVMNGTRQTFNASSGFSVKATGQSRSLPVLTGTEQWKPGQFMVFYVVSKKYTPLRPIEGAGFEFNLAGSHGTAIPGPSGIFLRIKYEPATISKIVDFVVAHGPGSKGHQVGLPDTQIWEFVSARNHVVIP